MREQVNGDNKWRKKKSEKREHQNWKAGYYRESDVNFCYLRNSLLMWSVSVPSSVARVWF